MNGVEYKPLPDQTLDEIINILLIAKQSGAAIFVDFNGVTLSSENLTIDKAYQQVYGCSKADYNLSIIQRKQAMQQEQQQSVQDLFDRVTAKRARAVSKIPYWQSWGTHYISAEKQERWNAAVTASAYGMHIGRDLEIAANLITMLSLGADMSAVVAMADEEYGGSDNARALIRDDILKFSNRGPDFYEASAKAPLSSEEVALVSTVRAENAAVVAQPEYRK